MNAEPTRSFWHSIRLRNSNPDARRNRPADSSRRWLLTCCAVRVPRVTFTIDGVGFSESQRAAGRKLQSNGKFGSKKRFAIT